MDFSGILSSDFLTGFFNIVIQVIMSITSILLLPFSVIISQFIPDFDSVLTSMSQIFTYALTYMGWILSAFAVPAALITVMAGYYTFIVMTKMSTWGIKLGLSWYRALK